MDIVGEEHGRLERLLSWLDATRAELTGLAVLLLGAVVATGALWWSALAAAPGAPASSGVVGGLQPASPGEEHTHAGRVGSDGHAADRGPTGGVADGPAGSDPEDAPSEMTVHVTGAVASPGVITVAAGARVADAIAAAGEATAEAETHRLNLARPLADGEQIHVPVEGEDVAPPPAGDDGTAGVDAEGLVDLNRADAATLETLPGIGPARAEAIIEYRETNGPFAEPGDLRGVSGIGEATFQRLAEDVTVS